VLALPMVQQAYARACRNYIEQRQPTEEVAPTITRTFHL
jgi:hypothetical protein